MKIPHGWKLVPIEPTEEMLKAACERAQSFEVLMDDTRFACDRASYAAAIAAAPPPPMCETCGGDGHINRHANEPDEPCPDCNPGAPSAAQRMRAAAGGKVS